MTLHNDIIFYQQYDTNFVAHAVICIFFWFGCPIRTEVSENRCVYSIFLAVNLLCTKVGLSVAVQPSSYGVLGLVEEGALLGRTVNCMLSGLSITNVASISTHHGLRRKHVATPHSSPAFALFSLMSCMKPCMYVVYVCKYVCVYVHFIYICRHASLFAVYGMYTYICWYAYITRCLCVYVAYVICMHGQHWCNYGSRH